jgi:hypothetical protein
MNTENPQITEGLRIIARIIARAYLNESLTGAAKFKTQKEITINEDVSGTGRNKHNRKSYDKSEK